jgi:hypothetical protein
MVQDLAVVFARIRARLQPRRKGVYWETALAAVLAIQVLRAPRLKAQQGGNHYGTPEVVP